MPKTIQIRDIPDAMHRRLKARAVMSGLPLSEFIRRELERTLERATRREFLEQLAKCEPVTLPQSAAELVRAERGH